MCRWRGWRRGWSCCTARLDPGARVVFLDNRFVPTAAPPLSRRDAEGNTYQQRTLDDGIVHEVLKNFPDRDGPSRRPVSASAKPSGSSTTHYWVLSYTLA